MRWLEPSGGECRAQGVVSPNQLLEDLQHRAVAEAIGKVEREDLVEGARGRLPDCDESQTSACDSDKGISASGEGAEGFAAEGVASADARRTVSSCRFNSRIWASRDSALTAEEAGREGADFAVKSGGSLASRVKGESVDGRQLLQHLPEGDANTEFLLKAPGRLARARANRSPVPKS